MRRSRADALVTHLKCFGYLIGERPQEVGKSKKLDKLVEDIKTGEYNQQQLFERYGSTHLRLYKGVNHFLSYYYKPQPFQMEDEEHLFIPVAVWFGEAGSGKTYDIKLHLSTGSLSAWWPKMSSIAKGWWDGYMNQDVVVFDDFRGAAMKPDDFIHLVNGMDSTAPIKGAYIPFKPKMLLITTDVHPINWWPGWYAKTSNNWAQIKRRLRNIYICNDRNVTEVTHENVDFYKIEQSFQDYKPGFNK